MLNLYRSFIQAFLSNEVAVCGQVARPNLENVLILLKRTLRIISFKPFKFHPVPFVNLSNILPRHLIYFKTIFSFMHDFVNDLAPPKFQNYLFILQKNTTIVQGPQRLVISITFENKTRVQGSGIAFPPVFFLYLNMNLNGIQRQLLNILMRSILMLTSILWLTNVENYTIFGFICFLFVFSRVILLFVIRKT